MFRGDRTDSHPCWYRIYNHLSVSIEYAKVYVHLLRCCWRGIAHSAMSLQRAGKYQRPPWRLSQEQKGLDERAILSPQRPSHPCGRPRRRPCGRTSSAWATSPCRSPRALLAHTPAGCGHGGTRKSRTSRTLQTWSVNPAAIAGVWGCHRLAEPLPLVGRGCGNGWRKEACGKQKL